MATSAVPSPISCSLCKIECPNQLSLAAHIRGKKHVQKLAEMAVPPQTPAVESLSTTVLFVQCPICPNKEVGGGPEGWQSHIKSMRHDKTYGYAQLTYDIVPKISKQPIMQQEQKKSGTLQHQLPQKEETVYSCMSCGFDVPKKDWVQHMSKDSHRTNLRALLNQSPPRRAQPKSNQTTLTRSQQNAPSSYQVPPDSQAGTKRCEVCDRTIHLVGWDDHTRSPKHTKGVATHAQPTLGSAPQASDIPPAASGHQVALQEQKKSETLQDQSAQREEETVHWCMSCNANVPKKGWVVHVSENSHRTNLRALLNQTSPRHTKPKSSQATPIRSQQNPQSPQQGPPNAQAGTKRCEECSRIIHLAGWDDHVKSLKHAKNVATFAQPASGSTSLTFDTLPAISGQQATTQEQNKLQVPQQQSSQNHHSNLPSYPQPVGRRSNHTASTKSKKKPKNQKIRCTTCNHKVFESDWHSHINSIKHRKASATSAPSSRGPALPVSDPAASLDLFQYHPASPHNTSEGYQPKIFLSTSKARQYVAGVVPVTFDNTPWVKALGPFPVPEDIEAIFASETPDIGREFKSISARVPITLSSQTYEDYWKTLLYVEEIQMRSDLGAYDMYGVSLTQSSSYFQFSLSPGTGVLSSAEIPGVTEQGIVQLLGEAFCFRAQDPTSEAPLFEAYVHYVHGNEIGLAFDPSFQNEPGQLYDVAFQLNRSNMRRMHEALAIPLTGTRRRILSPLDEDFDEVPFIVTSHLEAIEPCIVNNLVLDNPRQLLAVTAIKERPLGSPPLVVWGPPGTGKTTTLIEGVRQVLLKNPNARIMACAPSESAADLIAQRLLDLGEHAVFRLNAPTRHKSEIPQDLLSFSRFVTLESQYPPDSEYFWAGGKGYDVVSCPSRKEIEDFQVVVSTCFDSYIVSGIGVAPGHFTHIFIDEAGKALEPEVMIPIKNMADFATNVILFGDPVQLRPIVHSPIAKELEFGKSYLERLIELPAYDPEESEMPPGVAIVRLTRNFRSHPAILEFPREVFYDNKLWSHGESSTINDLENWRGLPTQGFPVIFHTVEGREIWDDITGSYWNLHESCTVEDYVESLCSAGLASSDIGIISPYRDQCHNISVMLSRRHSEAMPKIGNAQEFLGQERKVIIISTVRSRTGLPMQLDNTYQLGVLADARQLNVAMTRAQALLIVIGDSVVLGLDPLWRYFLNFVYLEGGWVGPIMNWDPKEGHQSEESDDAEEDDEDFYVEEAYENYPSGIEVH